MYESLALTSSPATALSSVLFPHPFTPIRPTFWPLCSERVMSLN